VSTAIKVAGLWKVYPREGGKKIDTDDPEILQEKAEKGEAVIAVKDVSFEVASGDVFVVMGLSGSGKSTLIRCLLRLVEPTRGQVYLNDNEITNIKQDELTRFRREDAAMVFQHFGLMPHRSVLDNVAFGLKLKGISNKERYDKAREMIDLVGLEGWESYYPASLSGGMQQRVGIARALAADPPILLMDEPFSGLDPLIRREMQDELVKLQTEMNKTIFFVTHDLDEGMRLGDKMAVMQEGSFVQMGTPEEILQNPADDYVARFVQDKKKQFAMVQGGEKELGEDVS